jgi:hypothetical protein
MGQARCTPGTGAALPRPKSVPEIPIQLASVEYSSHSSPRDGRHHEAGSYKLANQRRLAPNTN